MNKWLYFVLIMSGLFYLLPEREVDNSTKWQRIKVTKKKRLWERERPKREIVIKKRLKSLYKFLFLDDREYYKK